MAEITTFADILKQIRKEKSLTQRDISIATGIAEPTIRKYESGKLNPKLETVQKFAAALDVPVSDLYGWDAVEKHLESIRREIMLLEIAKKSNPLVYDLLSSFEQLKPEGKRKAIDYVHDLTLIDQYTKPEE